MVTSSSSTNIQRKMAELVMNEVEKDFLIKKKLREMRLELIAVHKEREKEIEELRMRTGDLVAEGQVRTLKKVQGRDLERIMRLYIMVNKSHLSIHEKKFFVGNMELYNHQLALGWHLEEIHVTWAHLEKKRTRIWLYTKYLEEPRI
ncbi:hypothetical protein Tco_1206565 [Tanacetum coccineum]